MARLLYLFALMLVLESCTLFSDELDTITLVEPSLQDVIYGNWEIREVIDPVAYGTDDWQILSPPYTIYTFYRDGRFIHQENDRIVAEHTFSVDPQEAILHLNNTTEESWSVIVRSERQLQLERTTEEAVTYQQKWVRRE